MQPQESNEKQEKIVMENDPSDNGQVPYVYRWNYGEQKQFEEKRSRRRRRNGVVVYAVVMTAVFLVCFAMLAGMLIWYTGDAPDGNLSGTDGIAQQLTTMEIAERAYPATVLIGSSNQGGYSYGTGFFIRSDGYIATNYHVVEDSDEISVMLYAGKTLEAELVGFKAADDLAVLKIKGSNYPVLPIGNSDGLRVGERAIAIGNPAGPDGSWSTTQGIVSALNREIIVNGTGTIGEMTMIQTDAPVNHGNSGGPLCNGAGEIIGIISRKRSDNEGIGYAIPINGAMEILNAIVEKGHADDVESSITKVRPTIGIQAASIKVGDAYSYGGVRYEAEKNGVLVSSVDPQGAAHGLLKVCDIIIAMDCETVADMDALTRLLYACKVGDRVTLTVWRDGSAVDIDVVLGSTAP